jgi:hypothetical protein
MKGLDGSNPPLSTIQSKSRLPGSSLLMLIDRAAPGDREKALTLLNEALESYERIGMPPCRRASSDNFRRFTER